MGNDQYTGLDYRSSSEGEKDSFDLVLLGYMAQKIYFTLYLLDQSAGTSQPLRYSSEVGQKHTLRLAIYRPQELLLNSDLAFVGFVSGKQKPGSRRVVEEIHRVDKKLIDELVSVPSILSYSSLELRDGNWCNLVLLSDASAKTHFRNTQMHAYAAYELAPRYYEWVRLHHGIMSGGLARNEMILQKTRYYRFHGPHQRPTIQEMTYGA